MSIAELSREWMKQGAALIGKLNYIHVVNALCSVHCLNILYFHPIGGCCRISPAHIAELRQQLHCDLVPHASNVKALK